ncbi:hypothetical protein [Heyndrickxia camelliae]|uniref:Uncharacterized protein n=1 Tax=Heyndrickxia camelliae TaxID=1707093 RepID=A0A2N3LD53_9BACI|nr:hypothetical protein [Heyndrickxia camelliae]PKR82493.1 hypothetical protein CWO92_24135 [Heyndrickxia camelliae]
MLKKCRVIVAVFSVLILSLSGLQNIHAESNQTIDENTPIVQNDTTPFLDNQEELSKLSSYVVLNEESLRYEIKEEAKQSLTDDEFNFLYSSVNTTNEQLNENTEVSLENLVIPSNEQVLDHNNLEYKNGVTKLEWHWWGLRVYLSKNTINYASGGVAIGGIWIPEPIISKVLSTLGVLGTFVPGGVRFDFIGFRFISNVHYQ